MTECCYVGDPWLAVKAINAIITLAMSSDLVRQSKLAYLRLSNFSINFWNMAAQACRTSSCDISLTAIGSLAAIGIWL